VDFQLVWFSVPGHVASEAVSLPGEVITAISIVWQRTPTADPVLRSLAHAFDQIEPEKN
jgi:hypothetical protein